MRVLQFGGLTTCAFAAVAGAASPREARGDEPAGAVAGAVADARLVEEPAQSARPVRASCFGWDVPDVRFDALGAEVRVGAYAAFDAIHRSDTDGSSNSFGATDLRPLLDVSRGAFRAHVEGDAVGTDTPRNLYEAWAAWEATTWLRLGGGQFKVPLGSEAATHERDLPFVGYGFTTHLDTRHDVGARIDGRVGGSDDAGGAADDDWLWYQAAWVSGHGFGTEGDRFGSSQMSVRATLHPFRAAGMTDAAEFLRNLHVGAGWADRDDAEEPVIVVSPVQAPVFQTPDLDGDGGNWLHLEFGTSWGPFALGFEDVVGSADGVSTPGGGRTDMDELTAFTWHAAWNLSGERRALRDGAWRPVGAAPEPGGRPEWLPEGTWTLAARYSNADIDRRLFDAGWTTYGESSQETRTFSLALAWEPCATARVMVGWVNTIADDDVQAFDDGRRDQTFVLRVELRF